MSTPLCPTARKALESLPEIPDVGLSKVQVAILAQEICAQMVAIATGPLPQPIPVTATPPRPPSPSGQFCPKCGGEMVRTGTCLTCQSCGDTSGGCS